MPHLIWSPPALADVQRLYHFLAQKDETTALRTIKAIRTEVKILGHQPGIGRPIDGMDLAFRERVLDFANNGYIVLYRLERETTIILAVRHQKEAGYPS